MTASRSVRASVLLLVAVIVAVPAAVDLVGAQSQVAITDVNVSPSNPGVGEITTFTVTLRNSQGASETFEVEDLFVRAVSGTAGRLATAENPGSIPPARPSRSRSRRRSTPPGSRTSGWSSGGRTKAGSHGRSTTP